jgi:hypothetical protein
MRPTSFAFRDFAAWIDLFICVVLLACAGTGGGAWMAEVILFSICHNTIKEYQKWHLLI